MSIDSSIVIFTTTLIIICRLVGLESCPSWQRSPSPSCSTQISEAKDAFGSIHLSPLLVNTPLSHSALPKQGHNITISSRHGNTGIIFITHTKSPFISTSQRSSNCSLFSMNHSVLTIHLLHGRLHLHRERCAGDERKDRSWNFNAFPKGLFYSHKISPATTIISSMVFVLS